MYDVFDKLSICEKRFYQSQLHFTWFETVWKCIQYGSRSTRVIEMVSDGVDNDAFIVLTHSNKHI